MKTNFQFTAIVVMGAIASMQLVAADFEIKNETEFKKIIPADAKLEKLAGGFKFTEGPVWIPKEGGYLIFSDIPANHLKRWSKKDGVSVFREDSHNANGNTINLKNQLVTAEHSGRRVSLTGDDGVATHAGGFVQW